MPVLCCCCEREEAGARKEANWCFSAVTGCSFEHACFSPVGLVWLSPIEKTAHSFITVIEEFFFHDIIHIVLSPRPILYVFVCIYCSLWWTYEALTSLVPSVSCGLVQHRVFQAFKSDRAWGQTKGPDARGNGCFAAREVQRTAAKSLRTDRESTAGRYSRQSQSCALLL